MEILQIQPKLGIRMKVSSKAQRGFRSNPAALMHNLTDARCGHV